MTTKRRTWRALWRAVRTDGCTAAPDWTSAWTRCCNRHDRHYTTHRTPSGAPITRAEADRALLRCLRATASDPIARWIIATTYYAAVRLAGAARWTTNH